MMLRRLELLCFFAEPLSYLGISFTCFSRDLEYRYVLVQSSYALHVELLIKVEVRDKVYLVQKDDVRLFESERIFVRFVASFCYCRNEHHEVLSD